MGGGGGGEGLQIPFPTQNFAQIPFPSQIFVEIPVPKFSTPHIRIKVFTSSLTEQFKGISNLQFSVCATRLVEETYLTSTTTVRVECSAILD